MDTVFVRQVAPSGPADRAGLSTGKHRLIGTRLQLKQILIEIIVANKNFFETCN